MMFRLYRRLHVFKLWLIALLGTLLLKLLLLLLLLLLPPLLL